MECDRRSVRYGHEKKPSVLHSPQHVHSRTSVSDETKQKNSRRTAAVKQKPYQTGSDQNTMGWKHPTI